MTPSTLHHWSPSKTAAQVWQTLPSSLLRFTRCADVFKNVICFLSEMRAVPLINPGRGGFEELRLHFLTEKEQQQKDKLLKDYLMLIEIPVIGLGYDPTQIITAARYLWLPFYCIIICCIIYVTVIWDTFCKKKYMWVMAEWKPSAPNLAMFANVLEMTYKSKY